MHLAIGEDGAARICFIRAFYLAFSLQQLCNKLSEKEENVHFCRDGLQFMHYLS